MASGGVPQTVTMRPADNRDWAAIARLTNYYILETSVHFGTEPVTPDEIANLVMKTGDRYPWVVAECSGPGGPEFAGYAKAGVWRNRAAYDWTAETGIYIERGKQGKGIGRQLYADLITRLRHAGFHSIVAGIALPNAASVALHECLGFVSVGVVRQAGYKMGAWRDAGFWQLMLTDAAAGPPCPPIPLPLG